jgi:hypothetical protein
MWNIPRIVLLSASTSLGLYAQQPATSTIDLGKESHHQLLLDNSWAHVYRLVLQPSEATQPHRHDNPYVFVTIGASSMSIEVRGRQPVVSDLEDGELRTSKGGFTISERNGGQKPMTMIVVEELRSGEAGTFEEAMASFRYHDAAIGSLFEDAAVRGYEMTMASGGRTNAHTERYNRLLVALTDLQLVDDIKEKGSLEIRRKAGDVEWLAATSTHALTNSGTQPARFIILEFR